MNTPKRSDEPIWWALFSAGGVCFAVFLPGLILILGFLWPLGLLDASLLQYAQLLTLLQNGYGLTGLAFTCASKSLAKACASSFVLVAEDLSAPW